MNHICLGIHFHTGPERLHATIASIRSNTSIPIDLLLLPDGPEEAMQRALVSLSDLRQFGTSEPRGAAACFNRLIQTSSADIYILLESGSLVGPGWLDYLLAALDSDPRNGMAGPSTNRIWNEQCVFPHAGGKPEMIANTAKEAAQRFGPTWRLLEPLYGLADFCYAVRLEVIESIGAADEGYGVGPCWEMDYNIRAARAGWRGVWACAAYVYREPFTLRRAQSERLYFEANKHRYQDKFCGLRLDGDKRSYESHCRGDACGFFAPAAKIQISIPFEQPKVALPNPSFPPALEAAPKRAVDSPPDKDLPYISCIMPTRGRLEYVQQSIRYFQRQEYPNKELLIVDDSVNDISQALPNEPNVRVLHSSRPMSIGAKRNWACEEARGPIIAQWDDDDYYGPGRLTAQVAPLLAGQADISGLVTGMIFDLPQWTFWRLSPALHNRMFFGNIHGGTLVYWRKIWQKSGRYPDRSLAEDAFFLSKAVQQGARLARLENQGDFIYIRHTSNSWSFQCGKFMDPTGWQRVPEPSFAPEDRTFYSARRSTISQESCFPLVSAIMPTANRRPFVSQAIEYFRRQSYPNRELIVVDDGIDPIGDLIPQDQNISYLRLVPRLSVGAKRNIACKEAHGELILHWDDDDWHAPHRISYQVESLLQTNADVGGLNTLLFYDQRNGQAWRYSYPPDQRFWLAGSTLCYRKSFWANHRFPEIDIGEDARFIWSGSRNHMTVLSDSAFHVSIIHGHNVSPKQTRGAYWKPYSVETIRELMLEDWAFYNPQLSLEFMQCQSGPH